MTLDPLLFKAKAMLAIIVLAMTPMFVMGCGQTSLPAATGLPVANADALSQKLVGTPFANPRLIEVSRPNRSFRIISGDGSSTVSGQYSTDSSGQAFVSSFAMSTRDRAISLKFNEARQITEVITSGGLWRSIDAPPLSSTSSGVGARAVNQVDTYVAANAEVLSLARQADGQAASTASIEIPVKADGQALALPLLIFGSMALWPIGAAMTILWVIEVVVILNILF